MFQRVTDEVLAELAKGTAPGLAPWRVEFGLPRNLESRRAYRGVNVLVLMTGGLSAGYLGNWWLTYHQALELGGHVNKGERGLPVVFYKGVASENPAQAVDGDDVTPDVRWHSVLKTFTVFNASQCTGIAAPPPPSLAWQPVEAAERIVESLGNLIHYAGTVACYRPGADTITMPPRAFFPTVMGYYETMLHEAVHATGHESRLARPLGKSGTDADAWEELIAEMGSACSASWSVCRCPISPTWPPTWTDIMRCNTQQGLVLGTRLVLPRCRFRLHVVRKHETPHRSAGFC